MLAIFLRWHWWMREILISNMSIYIDFSHLTIFMVAKPPTLPSPIFGPLWKIIEQKMQGICILSAPISFHQMLCASNYVLMMCKAKLEPQKRQLNKQFTVIFNSVILAFFENLHSRKNQFAVTLKEPFITHYAWKYSTKDENVICIQF